MREMSPERSACFRTVIGWRGGPPECVMTRGPLPCGQKIHSVLGRVTLAWIQHWSLSSSLRTKRGYCPSVKSAGRCWPSLAHSR